MIQLNNDIIRYISSYLDLTDIINFSNTCKYIYNTLDNKFYEEIAISLYSEEFWIKAKMRSKKKSKPLGSIKKELLRLDHFQKIVELHFSYKFTITDFYDCWRTIDYMK